MSRVSTIDLQEGGTLMNCEKYIGLDVHQATISVGERVPALNSSKKYAIRQCWLGGLEGGPGGCSPLFWLRSLLALCRRAVFLLVTQILIVQICHFPLVTLLDPNFAYAEVKRGFLRIRRLMKLLAENSNISVFKKTKLSLFCSVRAEKWSVIFANSSKLLVFGGYFLAMSNKKIACFHATNPICIVVIISGQHFRFCLLNRFFIRRSIRSGTRGLRKRLSTEPQSAD